MIKRRARKAGLPAEICAHSFRGTGITEYLRNGGCTDYLQQEAVARAEGCEPWRGVWRGTSCLRRAGGAQSGFQVLLGVMSAVTGSKGMT